MASPNYDQLHIDHSKRIGDPVAAAATDGKIWTSTGRDIHLNESSRRLMFKYLKKYTDEERAGVMASWDFFRSLINEEAQTLTANVKALSGWTGDVFYILGVKNATKSVMPLKMPEWAKYSGDVSDNDYFIADSKDQYWTVDGGNFRLVDGGSATADSISLRYIKAWASLTQANATDIPLPAKYFHEVLDIAFKIAMEEVADVETMALAQAREAEVDKEIGLTA